MPTTLHLVYQTTQFVPWMPNILIWSMVSRVFLAGIHPVRSFCCQVHWLHWSQLIPYYASLFLWIGVLGILLGRQVTSFWRKRSKYLLVSVFRRDRTKNSCLQHTYKAFVFVVPLLGATLIAITRIEDYRHHWSDCFIGGILGESLHLAAILAEAHATDIRLLDRLLCIPAILSTSYPQGKSQCLPYSV